MLRSFIHGAYYTIHIMNMMKRELFFIGITLIFALALFLRFYKFYEGIAFRGDQGSDLYIARSIMEEGHRPMVGPLLTVNNFFTPPTYYYFLAVLYYIFRTPEGVTAGFALMNLIGFFLIIFIASRLMDRYAGLIVGLLYASSAIMVSESRWMWQPHPLTFFLLVSLLLLLMANRERKTIYLLISLFFYMIAVAIYPSPLLLFPFYFVSTVEYFRIKQKKWFVSIIQTITAFLVLTVPIYGAYIHYENIFGYPTLEAIQSTSFGIPLSLRVIKEIFFEYITGFIDYVFNVFTNDLFSPLPVKTIFEISIVCMLFIFLIFISRFPRHIQKMYDSIRLFFKTRWLFIGVLPLLFFRNEILIYRIYIFIPFFLIFFSFFIRALFSLKRIIFYALAIGFIGIYMLNNLLWTTIEFFIREESEISQVTNVATVIANDSSRTGLTNATMSVLAYRPGVYANFLTFPYMYYLRDLANYSLPFVQVGNDVDRNLLEHPRTTYVYLICKLFPTYTEVMDGCAGRFTGNNEEYQAERRWLFSENTFVFKFHRTLN